MTTITHTKPAELRLAPRERTGGSRGEGQPDLLAERGEHANLRTPFGSHMPLDATIHWNWRNPLNIVPAFMILLFVLSIVGLLVR